MLAELFLFGAVAGQVAFDKVISLGDSISDTGNFYKLSNQQSPSSHFYEGRLSNGPVWIEHVASNFSASLDNYAYGGATSDGDQYQVVPGYHIPGCIQQVAELEAALARDPLGSDRVLLQMGFFGNDFFALARTATSMANLERCLTRLLDATHAKHVVVPTSNDPDLIPVVQGLNFAFRYYARNIAADLPAEWEKVLQRVSRKNPGVKFYSYDHAELVRAAANGTLEYTAKKKFKNGYCLKALPDKSEQVCANPQDYLFYDWAHPSKVLHKAMADAVTQLLHTGTSPFGHVVYTPPRQ